jgi:hypothetical protein
MSSSGVGPWTATTSYPITVDSASCVTSGSLIYCFAGYTANGPRAVNATYYATLSASGVSSWTQGPAYPTADYGLSCGVVNGYAYCVGGITESENGTDAVYYTPLSAAGMGPWNSASGYPIPINSASCATTGNIIACIAGYTTSYAGGATGAVYYGSVS